MERKNINDDTPRSNTSPRDDRFFTPRTIARSNSTSTSDEWTTPRHESDFVTPRSYYDADRKEYAPAYSTNTSAKDSYTYGYDPQSHYAQAKQFYGTTDNNSYSTNNSTIPPPSSSSVSISSSTSTRFTAHNRANYHHSKPQYIAEEDETHFEEDPHAAIGIDETDIEDIFSFARHGRIEEIERLLDKGVPVDVRDIYGNTMLITACQNGNKRVAKAVLRRGADINARNFKGNTPLHYCYQCK
jgi:hypothetical protein